MRWIWVFLLAGCGSAPVHFPPTDRTAAHWERPALREGDSLFDYGAFSGVFDSRRRVPVWVAYRLTAQHLAQKSAPRFGGPFFPDPEIAGCPVHEDYQAFRGYDRGHLAPSADFRWSAEFQKTTFQTTNIAPQKSCFNRGLWARLEKRVRDWAERRGETSVVAGPVGRDCQQVAKGICAPRQFFKAVLARSEGDWEGIGFVFANDCEKPDLSDAAMTIDALESLTGLDLFAAVDRVVQERAEARLNKAFWFTPLDVASKPGRRRLK